jgi:hypothetical protein
LVPDHQWLEEDLADQLFNPGEMRWLMLHIKILKPVVEIGDNILPGFALLCSSDVVHRSNSNGV